MEQQVAAVFDGIEMYCSKEISGARVLFKRRMLWVIGKKFLNGGPCRGPEKITADHPMGNCKMPADGRGHPVHYPQAGIGKGNAGHKGRIRHCSSCVKVICPRRTRWNKVLSNVRHSAFGQRVGHGGGLY